MKIQEQDIEKLVDHLESTIELIKADLKWQLSFEEIDWDHFSEFVESAKVIHMQIKKTKLAIESEG